MYIDPAATSYIVQVIAGIVISCGVILSLFWKKIRLFFRNKRIESTERKLNKEYQVKNSFDKMTVNSGDDKEKGNTSK